LQLSLFLAVRIAFWAGVIILNAYFTASSCRVWNGKVRIWVNGIGIGIGGDSGEWGVGDLVVRGLPRHCYPAVPSTRLLFHQCLACRRWWWHKPPTPPPRRSPLSVPTLPRRRVFIGHN